MSAAAPGVSASSVEGLVKLVGAEAAKKLPGIGDKPIMKALTEAMDFGDTLLKNATAVFTRGSKLLSATADAVYRHGDVAERVSGFVLERSGLFSTRQPKPGVPAMGPIQNRSGHGIDWVGIAITGAHAGSPVFFEVKGGLNGPARGLSAAQSKLAIFAPDRVERATKDIGAWANHNKAPGTAEFAMYIRHVQSITDKPYVGYVFQHDNMRTNPSVRWSHWK